MVRLPVLQGLRGCYLHHLNRLDPIDMKYVSKVVSTAYEYECTILLTKKLSLWNGGPMLIVLIR